MNDLKVAAVGVVRASLVIGIRAAARITDGLEAAVIKPGKPVTAQPASPAPSAEPMASFSPVNREFLARLLSPLRSGGAIGMSWP